MMSQLCAGGTWLPTAVIIAFQLFALMFGAAPGTLSWLLLSRVRTHFPNRRRWEGAASAYTMVTLLSWFAIDEILAKNFLGCSGAFLLLAYGGAKYGCFQLDCCGWIDDPTRLKFYGWLPRWMALQKLEAMVAALAGIVIMACAALDRWSDMSLFFAALVVLSANRLFFTAGRRI